MTIRKQALVWFAAYLIGLHALLSGFAPLSFAAPSFDPVICHNAGSSAPDQPADDPAGTCEHCVLCQLHAPIAAAPPSPSLAIRTSDIAPYDSAIADAAPTRQNQNRYLARAPPSPM